ncbi:MAG: leucyl aminopeptidase family protein [Myxococcota bacterium]
MDFFSARSTKQTIPIHVVTKQSLGEWLEYQDAATQAWVKGQSFSADPGRTVLLPGAKGQLRGILLGVDDPATPWCFAGLPANLPPGRYMLPDGLEADVARAAALGWALGSYRFQQFKSKKVETKTVLVWPDVDRAEVTRLVESIFLVRDMINTPAGDLGPQELAATAKKVGRQHDAKTTIIKGGQLLEKGYPAIHAVGRASSRPPCLVDIRWGRPRDPKLTLVGKGVVFDSGGLDLKPSSGMLLMKKDMGGSAIALGLAHAIMAAKWRVRLRVLLPAVENAVSGDSFRPLDVLPTRKGLTVEVGNTDAEGRLILCDALAEGDQESPEVLLDVATLTGAARVALGTEVPVLFSNDDQLAADILTGGQEQGDPLWRLPLHAPYRRHIESKVADISSTGQSRFGGAIIAALFLQSFVSEQTKWAHVDVMAWNSDNRPGRPYGGEAMGLRGLYAGLAKHFNIEV